MRQVDKIKEPNSLNKQSNLGNSNFNSLNKGHKLLKLRNQKSLNKQSNIESSNFNSLTSFINNDEFF